MNVQKVVEDLITEFGEDTVRKMINNLVKDLTVGVKDCIDCIYYEENGIHMSAEPECMKYKEWACEARSYCAGKEIVS